MFYKETYKTMALTTNMSLFKKTVWLVIEIKRSLENL